MPEAVSLSVMPAAAPVLEPVAHGSVSKSLDPASAALGNPTPDIIDIRRTLVETNLKDEIFSLFDPASGPRKLPTLLLYNEKGLQLFEEVSALRDCLHVVWRLGTLTRGSRSPISKSIT